jgi:tRNA dimethylallyltransferase
MNNKLVAVVGPTATGKTQLGVKLADSFNGEIISADSRQVYKGMDIGTGKDLNEYVINGRKIKYHLIDIVEPAEEYNIFLFKKDFIKAFEDIGSRGRLPFIVGGSGLYLSAVIQDYKLEARNLTDDVKELSYKVSSCVIGVSYNKEEIRHRITKRLKARLETGMIDEVKALLEKGVPYQRLYDLGLEYKYIALHLSGELNYNDMYQKLNSSIHAFAKRQMTWFRKMEREGVIIRWVDKGDFDKASAIVEEFLES